VVEVGGIKPGFSAWSCAASLVEEEEDLVGVDDDHGRRWRRHDGVC
jgi:hypothetical protein